MRRLKVVFALALALAMMVTISVAPAMANDNHNGNNNNNNNFVDRNHNDDFDCFGCGFNRFDRLDNGDFECCDDEDFEDNDIGFFSPAFVDDNEQGCWEWSWVFHQWEWDDNCN
jgi:hypothetical protein